MQLRVLQRGRRVDGDARLVVVASSASCSISSTAEGPLADRLAAARRASSRPRPSASCSVNWAICDFSRDVAPGVRRLRASRMGVHAATAPATIVFRMLNVLRLARKRREGETESTKTSHTIARTRPTRRQPAEGAHRRERRRQQHAEADDDDDAGGDHRRPGVAERRRPGRRPPPRRRARGSRGRRSWCRRRRCRARCP